MIFLGLGSIFIIAAFNVDTPWNTILVIMAILTFMLWLITILASSPDSFLKKAEDGLPKKISLK